MKIFYHLKSGAFQSLKSWKGILVIWILLLVLVSLIALPVRAGFKSMLGSSMITELLRDSINIDVITDLQQGFGALIPTLTTGFFLAILFGFIMNAFVSGGLFSILGRNSNQKVSSFFAGAASNFWSVLVITFITGFIIIVCGFLIIGLPAILVSKSGTGTPEPGLMGKVIRISLIVFALLLPILLLVTDYARAWQASHLEKKPFSAIGFGFSRAFRLFAVSYPVMFIIIIVQALFGTLVISKLLLAKPSTGGGVFLFFILSQILFIIKIALRSWRYSSVTSMMEDDAIKASPDLSVQVVEPLPGQA